MNNSFEVFILVIVGAALIWLSITLYFKLKTGAFIRKRDQDIEDELRVKPLEDGTPGDPKTCPVCSAKLTDGQLVSSAAFPAANGSKDRLMHIRGCVYCINGERDRVCPVCRIILAKDDILISRLYEKPGRRAHVHVLGCNQCKGPPSSRPV